MTWLQTIVQAYKAVDPNNGIANYSDIYSYIQQHRPGTLPRTWDAIIRREVEDHSTDSKNYKGGADLFYTVGGIGSGRWGLRSMLSPTPVSADIVEPDLPPGVPPTRRTTVISRVVRDSKRSRQLKQLYEFECQVCRVSIMVPGGRYAEGHHLKPLGAPHHGPDTISNILILCPNHHAEFDLGALAIDPATRQVLHIDPASPVIGQLLLVLPDHELGTEYLRYHFDNIFSVVPTPAKHQV